MQQQEIERLRESLRRSLEISKELASRVDDAGPRLEKTSQRLASLEASIGKISSKCRLYKIKAPVEHAFSLSASVFNVFQVICDLENSLMSSDPSSGLCAYLNTVKYTQDSLRFLTGYCRLAIPWLEHAKQLLEDIADDWYLQSVKKCLDVVEELQATEGAFQSKGGALASASDKLECELARILLDNTTPLFLPLPVIEEVRAIVERLAGNHRLESCISVYVEIRSSNVRETLEALGLDYLETPLTEFDSLQSVENEIEQWGRHLEFAVKHVFEIEQNLCTETFQAFDTKIQAGCFAQIAIQSGIQSFFKFGNTIANGKKEAIKLLTLLDIFAVLNKLRPDFNRLFSWKACGEIQTETRDLIKKVVNGVCDIFWELPLQVELQLPSSPTSNCSVPSLVTLVTDFCNLLLQDEHWSTLLQVVEIHQGWNHKTFDKKLITNEIHNIVIALEQNLETQARAYGDTALSSIFLINSHWYLSRYTKGTNLGDAMGEPWLRKHEEKLEHYEAVYLKESWGKLPALLNDEDQAPFAKAFDSVYKSQSRVVLCDKGLRWRICELVYQAVVPPYIEKYESPVEHTCNGMKYTPESLERMISSLFQPELGKFGNTKCI